MDRKTAERLMGEMLALGGPLDSATEIVDQIADKDERSNLRREIGELMGAIYTNIMLPIIRQYPDLDPDAMPSRRSSTDQ